MLLDQGDGLSAQIEHLEGRIEALIAGMPAAQAPPAPADPDDAGEPAYLAAVDRLDGITGVGRRDLGPEFFDNWIRPERRKINRIRQLEALGYTFTLTPAA